MPRKLFRYWLIPLLLGPACALALEIGEIQVNSALNQLFDARIPLPKLTPEELAKVSVKLAPPPMFKEFGLDRASALANLVFSVEYNAEGEVYVRVVSTQPIREPSLGLLLEFGWPRGKTFREFTVFLDPVRRLAKRPSDRTKTVLDASAPVASEPVAVPAPAPIPAPIPTSPPVATPVAPEPATVLAPAPAPAPATTETAVVAVAVPEAVQALSAPLQLPVEAPPDPVKAYKPGDSYGPVAAGEGLWKIALKVRPDPGITPDQMMQALFRANPHAFAKSGIGGLKVGSTLRIPTLREIAKFTGSTAAKRLAEAEEAAMVMLVETAKPSAELSASGPSIAESQTGTVGPKAFPLEPPAAIEPIVVEAAPLVAAPVSVKPVSEPAEGEPRSVPAASQAAAESRIAETAASPSVAAGAEFPRIAAPIRPSKPESVVRSAGTAPPVLEPVSATPLLFLAVSEVMASAVKIPAFAIPAQIVPGALIADVPPPLLSTRKAPQIGAILPAVAAKEGILIRRISEIDASVPPTEAERVTTELPEASDRAATAPVLDSRKSLSASSAATELLAVFDERIESVALDLAPYLAAKTSITPLPVAGSASAISPETPSLPTPANGGEAEPSSVEAALPVVETPLAAETAAPVGEPEPSPAEEVAALPAVEAIVSPVTASVGPTTEPAYKGGEQYGPVAPNERLWGIAAKVRPDPSIGKDVMMRALFMANPQAFSKTGMNQLKVGAVLRVPTLREIVDYTGSGVAKQLLELEQQRAAATSATEPAGDNPSSAASAPAESVEIAQPYSAASAGEPAPVAEPQPDSITAPAVAEPAPPQSAD